MNKITEEILMIAKDLHMTHTRILFWKLNLWKTKKAIFIHS